MARDDVEDLGDNAAATPVLSIGAVFGGSHEVDRLWKEPIRDLRRRIIAASERVESPLKINVVFQTRGKFVQPDFEGVRTGRFAEDVPLLMVQAALPESSDRDQTAVLLALLKQAVDEAEKFAKTNGVTTDLNTVRELVEALGRPE